MKKLIIPLLFLAAALVNGALIFGCSANTAKGETNAVGSRANDLHSPGPWVYREVLEGHAYFTINQGGIIHAASCTNSACAPKPPGTEFRYFLQPTGADMPTGIPTITLPSTIGEVSK